MTDTAIRTVDLRKTYTGGGRTVEAVAGLDLDVKAGEFVGLLGPNAAGKSTTIGMLTTRIVPTGGSAEIAGIDVRRHPVDVRRQIGVVTQRNTMDRQLSILEILEFRGRFFGMSGRVARRRGRELLEQFGIAACADTKDDFISGGQTRRAMVCRALMHRPPILILDEPTGALDPQTRFNLWEILRELHAAGQTILLTTHNMEEAEALCDRVAIVDHGRVLACDTVDGIKRSAQATSLITIVFDGDLTTIVEQVGDLPGVTEAVAEDNRLLVRNTVTNSVLTDILRLAGTAGLTVRDVSTLLPSLETAFLNLTGREYRE
jgi:ABC-2 type transport system ATP-binding protein